VLTEARFHTLPQGFALRQGAARRRHQDRTPLDPRLYVLNSLTRVVDESLREP
jgi:hypothetical protein